MSDIYVEYLNESVYHVVLDNQTACGLLNVGWGVSPAFPSLQRSVCPRCWANPRTYAVEVRHAAHMLAERFPAFRESDNATLDTAIGYLLAYADSLEPQEPPHANE